MVGVGAVVEFPIVWRKSWVTPCSSSHPNVCMAKGETDGGGDVGEGGLGVDGNGEVDVSAFEKGGRCAGGGEATIDVRVPSVHRAPLR